jgi:apolipoprotein D and lipocalin family protein
MRTDGRLDVLNQCRTADGAIDARGVARVVDAASFAKLKVRFAPASLSFLPFVWGDYWILGVADDYSLAVVGSPDRNYLWILARAPELSVPVFATAIDVARANGFDTSRLIGTNAARPR